MRHPLAQMLSATMLASLLVGGAEAASDPQSSTGARRQAPLPAPWSGVGSGVSGTYNYSEGEFIYTDHLYDDYGADNRVRLRSSGQFGLRNGPEGDFRYPSGDDGEGGPWSFNAADLIELRMAASDERLHVLARLGAMTEPDLAVVAVAFDANGIQGDGVEWGLNSNLRTADAEHVLHLWGTGGSFDGRPVEDVTADPETNTITGSIPLSELGTSSFRAWAATGLWNPAAQAWWEVGAQRTADLPGGGASEKGDEGNAFNVAFRFNEFGDWMEREQSLELRDGDISTFGVDVDLGAADGGPFPDPGRLHVRVHYGSKSVDGLEGVRESGHPGRGGTQLRDEVKYHFLGHDQPYQVYVPDDPRSLMVVLHGGGGLNHIGFVAQPGLRQLADELGAVLVGPLARGPATNYIDYALLDVLEVIDDARIAYGLAEDSRTYGLGSSMGGQGVYRILVEYPDLFAVGIAVVPPPGDDLINERGSGPDEGNGNQFKLLENLRNTPMFVVGALADVPVPYATVVPISLKLTELGYEHRFHTATQDHGGYKSADDWLRAEAFIAETTHDRTPARVTFKISEHWWRPDLDPRLVFDGAWWLSGIRVRDRSAGWDAFGIADITTLALEGAEPEVAEFSEMGIAGGRPYHEKGLNYSYPGASYPLLNHFEGTLTNVARVTLTLEAMGLDAADVLTASLEVDGPTSVVLEGDFDPDVSVDGSDFALTPVGLELRLTEGANDIVISS